MIRRGQMTILVPVLLAAVVVLVPPSARAADDIAPISHVLAFVPNETTSLFVTVQWAGTDVGSGIKDFTIYVSDNGGPFTVWQQNIISTAATFGGQVGHTYSFYSIARDVAGNVEAAKSVAEASITFISAPPNHPADTNNDWRLSINEITAYGAAWKRGDLWQTGPNPIPIDYVTNAGALWKTGELYRYDSTKNPPLCWIGAGN